MDVERADGERRWVAGHDRPCASIARVPFRWRPGVRAFTAGGASEGSLHCQCQAGI